MKKIAIITLLSIGTLACGSQKTTYQEQDEKNVWEALKHVDRLATEEQKDSEQERIAAEKERIAAIKMASSMAKKYYQVYPPKGICTSETTPCISSHSRIKRLGSYTFSTSL